MPTTQEGPVRAQPTWLVCPPPLGLWLPIHAGWDKHPKPTGWLAADRVATCLIQPRWVATLPRGDAGTPVKLVGPWLNPRCGPHMGNLMGFPWLGLLLLDPRLLFYVVVWLVQGTLPPLYTGTSFLVLNAFDVILLPLCLTKIEIKLKTIWGSSTMGENWQLS